MISVSTYVLKQVTCNKMMIHLRFIHLVKSVSDLGPQGFWGSRENGYLFSGSWGALVIIFRDLGSRFIVLGIYGALQKSKKNSL